MTTKTGTREWSEHSRNCCHGCSHACLYCYARDMALRFNRIADGADWANERINVAAVAKRYCKVAGTIMFPTTHDITEKNQVACVCVLRKLLQAGNRVLVVSKPDMVIFAHLREQLYPWKAQVMFRFSIGTLDGDQAAFWEPGAPHPQDRIASLRMAHKAGWQTSVSMEPLLTPWDLSKMIAMIEAHVTDTIWIGKCNKIRQRCRWAFGRGRTQDDLLLDAKIGRIEEWQSDDHVIDIYNRHKDNPMVRWKDSYTKVLRRYGIEVPHA